MSLATSLSGLLPWGPAGPQGLSPLFDLSLKHRPPAGLQTLARVAVEVEAQFLTHLLQQMRKSLVESLKSSPAGGADYQLLVDQNLARSLALGGGLGLARRIVADLAACLRDPKETAHEVQPYRQSQASLQ
ncbi:MAG: hypothetical protein JRI59_10260 [Deltaproteobacteria bacterium]|nr:hypothetical protein [Deltaproteobacteria bacterium]